MTIIQANEIKNAFEDSQHVTAKDDDYLVMHTSYRRGGCLYLGTVYLLNRETGAIKEFEVTSRASDTPEHINYLRGLAEKHVGRVS